MIHDQRLLKEAARFAAKSLYDAPPNPMVGAIVFKNNKIVARGRHLRYGGRHAEVIALNKAGAASKNATLYVTLEPCSSHGKTPPCTWLILESGVKRVVVGAIDPDPRHQGRGLKQLKEAGIQVQWIKEPACEDLLEDFKGNLALKRPYIIFKWASTLDGKIAAHDRSSQWISGPQSRKTVHQLRGHSDGVLVGAKTVLADNPRLNCRSKGAPLIPKRIVLDPDLKVSPKIQMIKDWIRGRDQDGFPAGPVWILSSIKAGKRKQKALEQAGAEILLVKTPVSKGSAFLKEAMGLLKRRGVHRLFVEGGSGVFTSMLDAKLCDQVSAFVAPKIVGGAAALGPIEGKGLAPMKNALNLSKASFVRSGADMHIRGFVKW